MYQHSIKDICVEIYFDFLKAGELSIVPSRIHVLSPCLKVLSDSNLTEMSFKYRRRHVDLMLNPHVRAVFYTRSKVIQSIRKFLDGKE